MDIAKEIRESIRKHLASLNVQQTNEEQVNNLKALTESWNKADNNKIECDDIFADSKLLVFFAKVLEEKVASYTKEWEGWIGDLVFFVWTLRTRNFFPSVQVKNMILALRKYVLCGNQKVVSEAMRCMSLIGSYPDGRTALLNDDEVYQILKKNLSDKNAIICLANISANDDWRIKLINDTSLIFDLLALSENMHVWNLLFSIAQHPDAKTLLPKEIIAKASKPSFPVCIDVCAMLCSENDLQHFTLSPQWITTKRNLLESMVRKGSANIGAKFFSWADLVLPIANLSTVDSLKEQLGKEVVHLLVEVLGKKAKLYRSKLEASRALWNFAYLESNRKRIADSNGIQKLKDAMQDIDDPIAQQNIAGVLHMFEIAPPPAVAAPTYAKGQGHVMISYNWGNQPLVLRLAKTLQNGGYNVWLDVEQMAGSTLGAMAEAIEGAELVLICMSQKYKDSPNCRLEGEYTINRKVPFVPLMMQQGYRADGWLGLALGAKLWYDFTSEDNWDTKITGLFKEIGERGKKEGKSSSPIAIPAPVSPAAPPKKSVYDWTEEEMHDWMKTEHIEHHSDIFAKHKVRVCSPFFFCALACFLFLFSFSSFSSFSLSPLLSLLAFSFSFYFWFGVLSSQHLYPIRSMGERLQCLSDYKIQTSRILCFRLGKI
eukprot:Phypoly_transcript_03098.p1 GENE.Phypoly_transcript_03098~~Phypoly_transcript_03098.p1  ORF type:complete len:657 (+),score=97.00 Phypoly_transcript_03098:524-2494(+)